MPSVLDPSERFGPFALAAMKGKVEDLELLTHSGTTRAKLDQCPTIAVGLVNSSIFGSNFATYKYLSSRLPQDWVHKIDHMGRGPLHLALEWCGDHVRDIVMSLIDTGADVHLRDLNGDDPGDVARVCDARALLAGSCRAPGNVGAYFDALKVSGFDVELDQDENIWWPSQDRAS